MLSLLKAVYDKLPKKSLALMKYTPSRILFGKTYGEYKSKISFDKSCINTNLFSIFEYSRKFTEFGRVNIPKELYIDEVQDVLTSLPLVTSSDLAENIDYFTSSQFRNSKAYLTTTGGTGRNPTSILLSNESFGIEWSHMHHIWSSVGYVRTRDIKLTLRGKSLKGSALVEYSPIYNELVVDTFKVKDQNFPIFVKQIKKYNICYIHGYPSLIKEFIGYFSRHGYIPDIKGIFLGSEGASVEDKRLFSEFFDADVVHWYGQSEKVTLAVDADGDDRFRVYTSYGYPRVVSGELVATTFVNRALPLINYRTGDSASIVEDGKYLYLVDLKGRWGKDFVYLNTGKKIPTSSINIHSAVQKDILFYQVVQKEFGMLMINVVPKHDAIKNSGVIKNAVAREIGGSLKDFTVVVDIVTEEKIQRSKRGKMLMLVQNLVFNENSSK